VDDLFLPMNDEPWTMNYELYMLLIIYYTILSIVRQLKFQKIEEYATESTEDTEKITRTRIGTAMLIPFVRSS